MKLPRDRIQLTWSLLLNGISKLPAILFVTSVLPRIKVSLGLEDYSAFLAALAFGSFFTLFFGGINAVVRRLVGTRFALADNAGEADVFVSALAVTGALSALACFLAVFLSLTVFSSMPSIGALVALFPILSAGLNLFDNVRAAYNEHYVTAALQFSFQLTVYLVVIILRPEYKGMIAAALVMQAPFMLSSAVTLTLLLVRRPYLLRGTFVNVAEILRGGFLFSIGDGALSGGISLSVFLLGLYGRPNEGAWYGTFVRLFQSVLSPVLLFMVPLSAFVTTKWSGLSARRRNQLINISLTVGLLYGGVSAAALSIGGNAFLQHFYHIAPVGSPLEITAISIFFMGILSEKAYGLIIYSMDNGRFLSIGTFIVVLVAALAALLAARWQAPLQTLGTFSLFGGLLLLLVITVDALRRRKRLESSV